MLQALFKNCPGKIFASMYYQLCGSLVKIVGFVLQFVVLTIRSCQINHQYQRDVLLADFGKFGKSWRNADDYFELLLITLKKNISKIYLRINIVKVHFRLFC